MKYLTISFDDGYKETFDTIISSLEKINIKTSWGLCPGIKEIEGKKLITKTDIKPNFEILDHSLTHTPVDKDVITTTISDFYVYPFGTHCKERKYQKLLSQKYKLARGTCKGSNNGINNIRELDKYNLKCILIKTIGRNKISSEEIIDILKELKNDEWVILVFHLVTNKPTDYPWSCDLKYFNNIINNIPKDIVIKNYFEVNKDIQAINSIVNTKV